MAMAMTMTMALAMAAATAKAKATAAAMASLIHLRFVICLSLLVGLIGWVAYMENQKIQKASPHFLRHSFIFET